MKNIKMKTMALTLGSAVLLGAGMHAYAETTKTPAQDSKDKSGSVGQYVDDATITARVKSKFASDSTVSATRISVDTVKGVVELSGNVSSEAEREQAITLARAVPDVRSVRSKLTLQVPTGSKPVKSNSPS